MGTIQEHLAKLKSAKVQLWRLQNPRKQHNSALRYRYGITVEQYDTILSNQGGHCALCSRTTADDMHSKLLVVDHDHSTGAIRGLLCTNCNLGLMEFRESPVFLRNAANYLEVV